MKLLRYWKLSLYAGMVGRGDNGDNKPWLGFYYGYWFPRIRNSSYGAAYGLDMSWLCFYMTMYWSKP